MRVHLSLAIALLCMTACSRTELSEFGDRVDTETPGVATPTGDLGCVDFNLGERIGIGFTDGNTTDAIDDFDGSCGGNGAEDVSYVWTAPESARYRVTTFGADFDTVLYAIRADCGGAEIICNDDTGGLQSAIELVAEAGESILFVVDGFGDDAGYYRLNIERLP